MELEGGSPCHYGKWGGWGSWDEGGGPLIDHKSGGCRPHTPTSERNAAAPEGAPPRRIRGDAQTGTYPTTPRETI